MYNKMHHFSSKMQCLLLLLLFCFMCFYVQLKLRVGCHLGGVFCGVVSYADDLLLMAPSRSAMEKMLGICEDYAKVNNLEFSTDPNPEKSKSKCIFMRGHLKMTKPVNLQLHGVDLPWVKTATHLGN